MAFVPSISLEEAMKTLFRGSTREELFAYCDQIGEKVGKNTKTENLQKFLCGKLNLTHESDSAAGAVLQKMVPKNDIFPKENYENMWFFGGKRYRIKVGCPPTAGPEEKGTLISINGEIPGYPIKYGENQVVPAPVYRRLMDLTYAEHHNERRGDDFTTVFEHHNLYSISTKGPEPGTEDLPESLLEWYQRKGPAWFNALNSRDLLAVCIKLDVKTRNKKDEVLPDIDLRANLFIFLYGYADVEPEPVAA